MLNIHVKLTLLFISLAILILHLNKSRRQIRMHFFLILYLVYTNRHEF